MRKDSLALLVLILAFAAFPLASTARAEVRLGAGDASLLGGDLSDPQDKVVDRGSYGQDLPEDKLRPANATWVNMKCFPANPPGTPAHQRHPYQSWQDAPACAIFLNHPAKHKWYVGFRDGGQGGPTEMQPYFCAVQLDRPYVLTHFTITTGPDMPGRDPKVWAIQGSNTGKDDDWTDLYRCEATDRGGAALQESPRLQTTLYTSFTSGTLATAKIAAADRAKLEAKLGGRKIEKADFAPPGGGYTWFRVAIFACYNANSMDIPNPAAPPGFALGQFELFGVPGQPAKAAAKVAENVEPPVMDAPFMISYWCGPPVAETTLARYQEIAECGFNVAVPPIDSKGDVATNRKILDLCKAVGIKALVSDSRIKIDAKAPNQQPALDAVVADYAAHPALLGYFLYDEPGEDLYPTLGAINQHLLKVDPKHLPYFNLLPNYAYGFTHGQSYEKYVSQFLKTVKPALLSWDHYRQMFERGDESFYWSNLEIVRRLCLKAKTPYIQIIVSLKHMGYRECSEADLRWQVYTSLAYGSRGIMYFTYWDVKELAWAGAPALITLDGKRDVKYEYAKRINNRIAKLGPTLQRLTCTGAYCTAPLPPGGQPLASDAPVTKAEGGPLLVGCFRDAAGKRYVFPVNRSLHGKVTARLTLDNKTTTVAEVSQETGSLAPVTLMQNVLEVILEPGEGRLFALTP